MTKMMIDVEDENLHRARKIAAAMERRHQYQIVLDALRRYLVSEGHLKDDADKDGQR